MNRLASLLILSTLTPTTTPHLSLNITTDASTLFFQQPKWEPEKLTFVGKSFGLTLRPLPDDFNVPEACATAVGMAVLHRQTVNFYEWVVKAKKLCPPEVVSQ